MPHFSVDFDRHCCSIYWLCPYDGV